MKGILFLGWNGDGRVDRALQRYIAENNGFEFWGRTEAEFMDELAEQLAAQNKRLDPKTKTRC